MEVLSYSHTQITWRRRVSTVLPVASIVVSRGCGSFTAVSSRKLISTTFREKERGRTVERPQQIKGVTEVTCDIIILRHLYRFFRYYR